MPFPSKEDPVIPVGVCLHGWSKRRLVEAAKREGAPLGAYLGRVLEDHASGLPASEEKDERQEEMFKDES